MTNAEKFLKDGASAIDEFINAYLDFSFSRVWIKDENSFDNITKKFFEEQVKSTLTEDEKIILSKLKSDYKYIGKKEFLGTVFLYVSCKKNGEELSTLVPFDHLFQFIKERRRIRDKGVIKR